MCGDEREELFDVTLAAPDLVQAVEVEDHGPDHEHEWQQGADTNRRPARFS